MERSFALTPGKRVLYLTKDPETIRRQLDGSLTLRMSRPVARRAARRHQHRRDDAGVGLLRLRSGGDREERLRRPHRQRPAPDPAGRARRRRLRGDRRRRAEGRRLEPRAGRAVRGVLGQPARDRELVRADPRAQQHQHRPADGRSRDDRAASRPASASRSTEFTRGHDRDHGADHRERRPAAVLRAAREEGDPRPRARHRARGR